MGSQKFDWVGVAMFKSKKSHAWATPLTVNWPVSFGGTLQPWIWALASEMELLNWAGSGEQEGRAHRRRVSPSRGHEVGVLLKLPSPRGSITTRRDWETSWSALSGLCDKAGGKGALKSASLWTQALHWQQRNRRLPYIRPLQIHL